MVAQNFDFQRKDFERRIADLEAMASFMLESGSVRSDFLTPRTIVPGDDLVETIDWKPFMTEQEAITYTKNSAYSDTTFYHGTGAGVADSIITNGLNIKRCERAMFGKGFYATTVDFERNILPSFGGIASAEFYARRRTTPTILEFKLNVKNPARFEDISEYLFFKMQNGILNDVIAILKSKGFDCLELKSMQEFVVFNPQQLAIYNKVILP